jgi:hypothetical protein
MANQPSFQRDDTSGYYRHQYHIPYCSPPCSGFDLKDQTLRTASIIPLDRHVFKQNQRESVIFLRFICGFFKGPVIFAVPLKHLFPSGQTGIRRKPGLYFLNKRIVDLDDVFLTASVIYGHILYCGRGHEI